MTLTIVINGCGLSKKCVVNFCQGNAILAIHFTVKAFNQLYKRQECMGDTVAKHLKEDWLATVIILA